VLAIVFNIAVVIDDVNTAGKKAERKKSADQELYFVELKELPREEGRNEQEQIFCPVLWSQ
jgi:hypothetical protein